MSLQGTTQLDHAQAPLSTDSPHAHARAASDANMLRYVAGSRGHVESHFLKANSPDGTRAIWLKHTLLVPGQGPALAEVWAIAFGQGGRHKRALKQSFSLHEVTLGHAPFAIETPVASLREGSAVGALGDREGELRWDLSYEATEPPFLPFPLARMYSGAFPRNKTLTPVPDARVHGQVRVGSETWQLDGWRGAQGHNWGKSHAEAYAWMHANALRHDGTLLEHAWVEALSGRVRLGPLVLPWLSVAGMRLGDRVYRFDGASALLTRKVEVDARSYRFTVRQGGATLRAELSAEPVQFAGLRYEDPDGRALCCLNSKLARAVFELTEGGLTTRLSTDQAALELGTRRLDHGVPILV